MKLEENLIAASATDKLGDVAPNSGTEERHGTCSVYRTSRDVIGFKYQVWYAKHDGSLEGIGDYGWGYIIPYLCWRYDTG